MIVVGLMSGTSVDGVDAAVVEITGAPPTLSVRLHSFSFSPFSSQERSQIFALFDPATSTVDRICQMNFALGEWFSRAALHAIQAAGLNPADVNLIGSHGQTLYHSVEPTSPVKSTLQMGEAAVIAERTGITTVADFRVADVAAGGQGAPLVGYVDWLLLHRPGVVRAIQNIGGIANVTFLPAASDPTGVFALDTGPGNMLIDFAAQQASQGKLTYDVDGRLAAQGRVNESWLAHLLAHPYFVQPLPKTTGREQFGVAYAQTLWQEATTQGLSNSDIVATLTALTAESIALAYARYLPTPPQEVILGGGGARNPTLINMLRDRLAPAQVIPATALGMNPDAKEAMAFAVLAYETLHGRPGNLPGATGARHPVILGKVVPGQNYPYLFRSFSVLRKEQHP